MLKTNIVIKSSIKATRTRTYAQSEMEGTTYTVFPSVMMIEGVYSPSVENLQDQGSLYFSADELKKSVESWNGRPVSVNHPSDFGSCNRPAIYNKQKIGYVFDTKFNDKSKALSSSLWIDNVRGKAITSKIANGDNIDVSIGARGDIISCPGSKSDYEILNIIGDHLAVLPNSEGACSWKDGCGIRASVYAMKEEAMNTSYVLLTRGSARNPSYDGTEVISWGGVSKSLDAYIKGYYKHTGASRPEDLTDTVAELPSTIKRWIASKSLLGDSGATVRRDLIFFPVVNPETNKLNEGALRAVLSGRGAQAEIPESARASAQKKAEDLLSSNFKQEVRGKKMSDCTKPGEVRKVEASEKEGEEQFDFEGWLRKAPPKFRNFVTSAMKRDEEARNQFVKEILSCDSVKFCKDTISSIEDLGLLGNIASLVGEAAEYKQEFDKLVLSSKDSIKAGSQSDYIDYGLRSVASSTTSVKKDYADFSNMNLV